MKILVTGAGFIGSHVCEELLNRGHEVTAMVHYNVDKVKHLEDKIKTVRGDIRFIDECSEAVAGMDAVIHLAALIHVDRSRSYPRMFWETNVLGTMNMLEACREADASFTHMSTCEVLGNILEGKADENYPAKHPRSPYAASKYAAEAYCRAYQLTYDMDIKIARGFNITGPRQKRGAKGAVIPIFMDQTLQEKPIYIYGGGQQTRDYTDARDIARGLAMITEHKGLSGELIHLCNGVDYTINHIAELVLEVCDSNIEPIHVDGRPGELMRSIGDNSKAKNVLGWEPLIPLKQTIRDIKKHMEKKQNG